MIPMLAIDLAAKQAHKQRNNEAKRKRGEKNARAHAKDQPPQSAHDAAAQDGRDSQHHHGHNEHLPELMPNARNEACERLV